MSDEPGLKSQTQKNLGTYYDRLGLWTTVMRPFGDRGGSDQLTVHRLLADPLADGRPTATRLHDLIVARLPRLDRPRLLDAGCGLGGTMLDLVGRWGGTAVGLTLSETQRDSAARAARARDLAGRVEARVQSYDSPPAGPFDVIVAIESLAHSVSPSTSVTALARVLAPGGFFVIVDDMPEPAAIESPAFQAFRDGWRAPVVWGRREYTDVLTSERLAIVTDDDLTGESRLRTLVQIARMERFNRAARALAPATWRVVLDSYYGGLALERLYREGLMRYRMLIARRS